MRSGITTACTRPRIALISCARLGRTSVGCAAGDAGRSAACRARHVKGFGSRLRGTLSLTKEISCVSRAVRDNAPAFIANVARRASCSAPRFFEVGSLPNKPMQPTANSAALIRKTWMLDALCARRLIGSVMSPLRVNAQMLPAAPPLNEGKVVWIIERLIESWCRLN